jgi:hypothetical protein
LCVYGGVVFFFNLMVEENSLAGLQSSPAPRALARRAWRSRRLLQPYFFT